MSTAKRSKKPAADWNALLVTRKGVTTLLKDLTEEECRRVAQINNMWGDPRPRGIRAAAERRVYGGVLSDMSQSRSGSDNDIVKAEYWRFGSDDKLDVWPLYEDAEERVNTLAQKLSAALAAGHWPCTFEWYDDDREVVWVQHAGSASTMMLTNFHEHIRPQIVALADAARKTDSAKIKKSHPKTGSHFTPKPSFWERLFA